MSSPESPGSPASTFTNPIRDRLRQGGSVIGGTLSVNNVEVAAQMAAFGFDFLWVDMEHTPIELETLRNMVLATRGLPAVPVARVPVNELWTAKRVLDTGVLGVIFPFTRSAEDARRAVAGCRYPPLGLRGAGADLARTRWPVPEEYHEFADENVLVVVIVEDVMGVSNIEEIVSTPGVDVLFIGTSDLSFSLGMRGRQGEPRLNEAIARIVTAARRQGVVLGRPALSVEDLRRFEGEGFQFFQSLTDLGLMAMGAEKVLGPLGRFRTLPSAGVPRP